MNRAQKILDMEVHVPGIEIGKGGFIRFGSSISIFETSKLIAKTENIEYN
jgi:hypothetical protein